MSSASGRSRCCSRCWKRVKLPPRPPSRSNWWSARPQRPIEDRHRRDRQDRKAGELMRAHLLVDDDDTLWENNVYFEHAIHDFLTFLNHSRLSHDEVRAVLDEVERLMGYGS